MKKTILIIFLCISINSLANSGKPIIKRISLPPDTTVLSQILTLPLSTYIGKPVDSLLSALPTGFTFRGFMPERIAYNRGVFQSYGDTGTNTVTVQIYIDNYQYMVFPDRTRASRWDMNLAKQETISFIKVIKNNNTCMFGCNNPNYSY